MSKNKALAKSKMFYTDHYLDNIRTLFGYRPGHRSRGVSSSKCRFFPKLTFNLNISQWLLMAHIQGTLNLFGYILSTGRYLQ